MGVRIARKRLPSLGKESPNRSIFSSRACAAAILSLGRRQASKMAAAAESTLRVLSGSSPSVGGGNSSILILPILNDTVLRPAPGMFCRGVGHSFGSSPQ